ncbi:hypothetical protein E2C01_043917 [Portunus trituberculatus]|uniref:Uncharacterized protein n=1 Tax=Portunus trituberculatus TaxID=210409 RepID=A0A5B7FWZ0_PORTR|nr:hypothetical protein [Portunus trituberculatus]
MKFIRFSLHLAETVTNFRINNDSIGQSLKHEPSAWAKRETHGAAAASPSPMTLATPRPHLLVYTPN